MDHPALDLVIVPSTRDLGDGFEVRRALPSLKRRMVGPFVFLDQMGPAAFAPGRGWTFGRIRTSAWPPSPTCWPARFFTATAWAACRPYAPAT